MLAGQRYSQNIIMIPAGEQGSFDVGFEPSTWIVFPTEQIQVGDFVYIAVDAQFSKTGLPITGTGQLTLSGMGGERVYLRNEGSNDVSLYVIATKGLVPPTVLTPVTIDGFTPDIYARKPFDEIITGSWIFDPSTGITTFRYSGDGQSRIHIKSEENDVGGKVGGVHIYGLNDTGGEVEYAAFRVTIIDPSTGAEFSRVAIWNVTDGEWSPFKYLQGGGSVAKLEEIYYSELENFGSEMYRAYWKALNSNRQQRTYADHWVKMVNTNAGAEEGAHYYGVITGGVITDVYRLDKNGLEILGARAVVASVLKSLVITGTPPIVVASTTKVDNLNADLLDGLDGVAYLDSANFSGVDWGDLTDLGQTTLHSHPLDSADFSGVDWTDLTDAGETALHSHAGGSGGVGVLEVQVFS